MSEKYIKTAHGDNTRVTEHKVTVIGPAASAVSLESRLFGTPDPLAGQYVGIEFEDGYRVAVDPAQLHDGPEDDIDTNAPVGLACPFCGESRLDHLVIDEDVIECRACKESYTVA